MQWDITTPNSTTKRGKNNNNSDSSLRTDQ